MGRQRRVDNSSGVEWGGGSGSTEEGPLRQGEGRERWRGGGSFLEEAEWEGLLKGTWRADHGVPSLMGQPWLECHHDNNSFYMSHKNYWPCTVLAVVTSSGKGGCDMEEWEVGKRDPGG